MLLLLQRQEECTESSIGHSTQLRDVPQFRGPLLCACAHCGMCDRILMLFLADVSQKTHHGKHIVWDLSSCALLIQTP